MDSINGHLFLTLLKLLYQFKPLFAFCKILLVAQLPLNESWGWLIGRRKEFASSYAILLQMRHKSARKLIFL